MDRSLAVPAAVGSVENPNHSAFSLTQRGMCGATEGNYCSMAGADVCFSLFGLELEVQ